MPVSDCLCRLGTTLNTQIQIALTLACKVNQTLKLMMNALSTTRAIEMQRFHALGRIAHDTRDRISGVKLSEL